MGRGLRGPDLDRSEHRGYARVSVVHGRNAELSMPQDSHSLAERLYHDTFCQFPCTFQAALQAASIQPSSTSPECIDNEYPELLGRLATGAAIGDSAPLTYASFLTMVFREAQLAFASYDCIPPRSEDSLTGSLQSRISTATNSIAQLRKQASRGSRPAHLLAVELILKGREQELGGDLAFLLEVGDRLFVTCLQAKRKVRNNGTLMSIAQERVVEKTREKTVMGEGDWQIERLSHLQSPNFVLTMNPAYLVYDNGDWGTKWPVLPLVKPLANFGTGRDDRIHLRMDLKAGTLDLASFVTSVVTNPAAGVESTGDNLAALVEQLVLSKWQQIMCLTSTVEFRHRPSFQDRLLAACRSAEGVLREIQDLVIPRSWMQNRPPPVAFDAGAVEWPESSYGLRP